MANSFHEVVSPVKFVYFDGDGTSQRVSLTKSNVRRGRNFSPFVARAYRAVLELHAILLEYPRIELVATLVLSTVDSRNWSLKTTIPILLVFKQRIEITRALVTNFTKTKCTMSRRIVPTTL